VSKHDPFPKDQGSSSHYIGISIVLIYRSGQITDPKAAKIQPRQTCPWRIHMFFLRLYSYPPHLNLGFFLFFTKRNLFFFSHWVVLVRHCLLLEGVTFQDSFFEKASYLQFLGKNVDKTCLTWNRIFFFH
jgi:hypothetical protein